MEDTPSGLLTMLYQKWKIEQKKDFDTHPSEEEFACLFDQRLSPEEAAVLTEHLIACTRCGQILAAHLKIGPAASRVVPRGLTESAKGIVGSSGSNAVEILLQWHQDALQLLETSGDVLLGQELMPRAVFRSRMIKDLTGGVTVLKDILDTRVEIKIERSKGRELDVTIWAKTRPSNKPLRDARVTLIKDGILLESYMRDDGVAVFTQVSPGKYTIVIAKHEASLVEIKLDIKV